MTKTTQLSWKLFSLWREFITSQTPWDAYAPTSRILCATIMRAQLEGNFYRKLLLALEVVCRAIHLICPYWWRVVSGSTASSEYFAFLLQYLYVVYVGFLASNRLQGTAKAKYQFCVRSLSVSIICYYDLELCIVTSNFFASYISSIIIFSLLALTRIIPPRCSWVYVVRWLKANSLLWISLADYGTGKCSWS